MLDMIFWLFSIVSGVVFHILGVGLAEVLCFNRGIKLKHIIAMVILVGLICTAYSFEKMGVCIPEKYYIVMVVTCFTLLVNKFIKEVIKGAVEE